MDVTQSRREVRVMPVATEETLTQRGPLPQNFAGPWSTLLPMQQVSDREVESRARRIATAGSSLSQSPIRRTESGVLKGHCQSCSWFAPMIKPPAPGYGACLSPRVDVVNAVFTDEVLVHGADAEMYVGPYFGCVHYEERV